MPAFIDIFKAVISGLIEGLTEFIPVSSTAHLLIFSWLVDFNAVKNHLFEIFIQLGAIMAVCYVYRKKLIRVVTKIHQKDSQKFVLNLFISFLPAAILGLLLHDFIKSVLFSPMVIAVALIVGGFIMIIVDSKDREPRTTRVDHITPKQALIMGFCQALAMIPGVSRSGATIVGGLLLRMNRRCAAEFSFFMSIVVISAASFFDLYKNYTALDVSNLYLILFGFLSSFISAIFVIRWFIKYVSNNDFIIFGIYRIMFGSIILFFDL